MVLLENLRNNCTIISKEVQEKSQWYILYTKMKAKTLAFSYLQMFYISIKVTLFVLSWWRVGSWGPPGKLQNFTNDHRLLIVAAVIWPKYCGYSLKHYIINQSICLVKQVHEVQLYLSMKAQILSFLGGQNIQYYIY